MPRSEYSSSEESKSSRSRRNRNRSRSTSRSSSSQSSTSERGSLRSHKKRKHRSRSSSKLRDRSSKDDKRRIEAKRSSFRRRKSRSRSRSRSKNVERRYKKSPRSSSSRTPSPPPKQIKVKRDFKQERYDTKNEEMRQKFQPNEGPSVPEQIRRTNELETLESSSFSVQSFSSSRNDKIIPSSTRLAFGTEAVLPIIPIKTETNAPSQPQTQVDKESICHPDLFLNPEAKMQKWVEKLYILRRNALKGRPLSS